MNDAQMREFRSLSRGVRLPDEVRARVTAEAEGAQARQPLASARMADDIERGRARRRPAARELAWVLPGPRAVALRAAAVLAFAVVLLAGSAFAGGPVLGALFGGRDPFVLRAYAASQGQGDATVGIGRFFSSFGLSGGDGNTFAVSGGFDLTVEAEGATSVTYTLESDELAVGTDGESLPRVYFEWGRSGKGSDGVGASLTVPYDEQLQTPGTTGAYRLIWYHGKGSDALAEARRRLSENGSDEAAWAQWRKAIIDEYNVALEKTRIRVSVAFEDGSTQEQTFVIRPVANYWQVSDERDAALDELSNAWNEQGQSSNEEATAAMDSLLAKYPLYTIDRIS